MRLKKFYAMMPQAIPYPSPEFHRGGLLSLLLHQRLKPRTKRIDFILVFLQPGKNIFTLGVKNVKRIDNAFFRDIDTQRILVRQLLKLYLTLTAQNPIQKNFSSIAV